MNWEPGEDRDLEMHLWMMDVYTHLRLSYPCDDYINFQNNESDTPCYYCEQIYEDGLVWDEKTRTVKIKNQD